MSKSELKRQAHLNPPVVNVLCAFPYFSKEIREYLLRQPREHFRLLVDSGAFTAHQSGKPISIDGYCKFLDSIEALRPFHAVQLDVIGNHEATLQNYLKMKERGYDVMPVFTRGSPISLMEELYKTTDYILIGGVAFGEQRRNYVKHLIPSLKGRKYHLLGFTDMDFVKTLKPFSVDSSGWESGGRYGRLYLYEGFGKFRNVGRENFFPKLDSSLEPIFRRMGLTSTDLQRLQDRDAWFGAYHGKQDKRGTGRFFTGYSHVLMAHDLERNLGTKFFLALGLNSHGILFDSRQMLEERMKEGLL